MIFTEADLDNLSRLARIDIDPLEKQKMLADMQSILGYVSEINDGVENSTRSEEQLYNVVREDVVTHETASTSVFLLNEAPATKDGYVEVMQVLK